MKRLRDFQPVAISCAPETMARCRVVAVQGEYAILQPEKGSVPAEESAWTPTTLSFEGAAGPVLLAGFVTRGPVPESLRFTQADGVRMPQLRASARLDFALPVQVRPIIARTGARGMASAAHTIDISAGGMLLGGYSAPDRHGTLQLEITVPGRARPLVVEAEVIRRWSNRTALRFREHVPELETFVLRCRQEIAKLAARRAAEKTHRLSGASLRGTAS